MGRVGAEEGQELMIRWGILGSRWKKHDGEDEDEEGARTARGSLRI
jgi:hypothetical protein